MVVILQDRDLEEYLRLKQRADDFLNLKIREYRVMMIVQQKELERKKEEKD